jgi:hypothetical protein
MACSITAKPHVHRIRVRAYGIKRAGAGESTQRANTSVDANAQWKAWKLDVLHVISVNEGGTARQSTGNTRFGVVYSCRVGMERSSTVRVVHARLRFRRVE